MSLYLVNIGLIVGILVALLLVTLGLRWWWSRWRRWREHSYVEAFTYGLGQMQSAPNPHDAVVAAAKLVTVRIDYLGQLLRISRLLRILNIATSVIALVPIGFATYNLVTNNQRQALTFNFASFAVVIVTKGGLFLLSWVLIPAFKALPAAVTGAIVSKKVGEMMDARKKKEKPPTIG